MAIGLHQGATAQTPPGQISTLYSRELVLRGRFVDAESGAPLPRCEVRLTGHQSTGYALAWAAGDWCDPPPQTTGDDGRFAFVVRVPAANEERDRNRYHLHARASMHVPWFSHCTFEVALAHGTVDYGDVRLPPGVRPRIRCVDGNGKLQPGVRLVLHGPAAPQPGGATVAYGPQSWLIRSTSGVTDIDGYLHLVDALQPGPWLAVAEQRGVPPPRTSFTLPSRDAIDVVVEPLPAHAVLRGRIVDERGEPLTDALLSTKGSATGSSRSQRDGSFVLLRAPDQSGDTAVVSLARNSRYDRWTQVATLDWGETDATITVKAKARATFEVSTEAGAPVEAFNLYCLPANERADLEPLRLQGTFTEGRAKVRLAPGDYQVLVYPRTPDALPGGWRYVTVDESTAPIRLQVPAPVTRAVQVACDGVPVAGALVEAITGTEPSLDLYVPPITADVAPGNVISRCMLAASARTGADGGVRLSLAADDRPAWLRISGRTIQSQIVGVPQWPATPLQVNVDAGAVLAGTIAPVDALFALGLQDTEARKASIYAHQRRNGPWLAIEAGRIFITRPDPLGRFEFTGLPPGKVDVQLGWWLPAGRATDHPQERHPLGTFDLTAGATTTAKFEVPAALRAK